MQFVTDLGDQSVILPLTAAVAILLVIQGWYRGAIGWLGSIGATLLAVLLAKLVCLVESAQYDIMSIQSPSGHTAAATVVSAGLAVFFTHRQMFAFPAAIAAAVIIGLSRYLLGAHSPLEVCVGACLGLMGAGLMRFVGRPPRISRWPMLAVVATVVCLFHGLHSPFERAIRRMADCISLTRVCSLSSVWAYSLGQDRLPLTAEVPTARE